MKSRDVVYLSRLIAFKTIFDLILVQGSVLIHRCIKPLGIVENIIHCGIIYPRINLRKLMFAATIFLSNVLITAAVFSFLRFAYASGGFTVNSRPKGNGERFAPSRNRCKRRRRRGLGVPRAPNPPGRLKNCERKSHGRGEKGTRMDFWNRRTDEIATSEGI